MKTSLSFTKLFICCISILFFILSCSSDEEKDTSLLVGIWDSRSILYYENEEWIDRSEFPGFMFLIFDGRNFRMGGPTLLMIDVKLTYSFDISKQIINVSDGTQIKVLKLSESELEIEETYETEERSVIKRSIYERRKE